LIISNSKRFIFIHIHKTGGTSITYALDPLCCAGDIVLGATDHGELLQKNYFERFSVSKHASVIEVTNSMGVDNWNKYFSFAFIRHPFDRAISWYKFARRIVENIGEKDFPQTKARGKEWILNKYFSKAYIESKQNKTFFSGFIRSEHFITGYGTKPQIDYVKNKNGDIGVDFIGRTETLYDDMKIVNKKIGIKFLSIPVINKSPSDSFKINEDDYMYLYDFYKIDFEAFGFDKHIDKLKMRMIG